MGAEDETASFGIGKGVAVADAAKGTFLVNATHVVVVGSVVEFGRVKLGLGGGVIQDGVGFHGVHCCISGRIGTGGIGVGRVGDVKGVLEVTSRMLLGDEESVEVPEAAVDVSAEGVVRWWVVGSEVVDGRL